MATSIQVKSKIDSKQPFHVYYDIEMVNNDVNGLATTNLTYTETRISPYLPCPSNYFMSVIRFSADTSSLPVMIPNVLIGQSDPNKLVYVISMTDGTLTGTRNITYIPADTTLTAYAPLTVQDVSGEYYFVYSYQSWVDMINATLKLLATDISQANAPFVTFDVDTSLMSIFVPTSYIGSTISIFFNNQLRTVLDSFQYSVITSANTLISQNGATNKLLYGNQNYTNNVTFNSIPYYEMRQALNTLPQMNPVRSIIFTSGLIPIAPSLSGPPHIFGQTITNNNNNNNIVPIITDLEVPNSNGNTYKNNVLYEAVVYRLFDMFSNTPIDSITITVAWKDKFGGIHPFKLNVGCSCSMKILFRRKDYNNVDLPIIAP